MRKRFSTLQEFWPFYVSEHSKAGTRALHFLGTTLLLILVVLAITTRTGSYLAAGIIAAYGFAWVGHFLIEKNRPATFRYPFYSLMGDFKMYGLMWRGKMEAELQRIMLSSSGEQRSALP
jgi:hypothetical protein